MTLAAISYQEQTGVWQTPGGKSIGFLYRADTNDWNTISSCLGTNDEYGLHGRELHGDVVDIGGYVGSVGITIAVDHPDARVLIVEPVPDNAALIERNAALNGVSDRVTVFHGAIGPKGTSTSEIRFRYVGDGNLEHHAFVGNTSLAYDGRGSVQCESADVETLGLAALLDRFKIGEPSFMKIDCEGGEWPFFETATLAALRRLPEIVGEAHPVRGHVASDMAKVLGKTHTVTMLGDWIFRAVRR
jgi:FkbM family methyltransferase